MKIHLKICIGVLILATVLGLCIRRGQKNYRHVKDVKQTLSGVRQVEVLTVNEQICTGDFTGKLSSFLLGASGKFSGKYQNDTIKMGVRFHTGNHTHLLVLELLHAELAHLTDANDVFISVYCNGPSSISLNGMKFNYYIRPSGRYVGSESFTRALLCHMHRDVKGGN